MGILEKKMRNKCKKSSEICKWGMAETLYLCSVNQMVWPMAAMIDNKRMTKRISP